MSINKLMMLLSLNAIFLFGYAVRDIYRFAYPQIEYKRNVIEVYYEADENGIRRGDNVITIDLSETNPKLMAVSQKEQ